MNDAPRYLFAMVLAMVVLFGWQIIFPPESSNTVDVSSALDENVSIQNYQKDEVIPNTSVECYGDRVPINSDRVTGSINLCGAKIDEIYLKNFRTSTKDNSDFVKFFQSNQDENPYWTESGWIAPRGAEFNLPDSNTLWSVESGQILTQYDSVTLVWDNGMGLIFKQIISLDENYLFSINQEITNNSVSSITLFPYQQLSRKNIPQGQTLGLLHEGPTGWFDDKLEEVDYDDIEDEVYRKEFVSGWLGIRDKYWASALSSNDTDRKQANFKVSKSGDDDYYRVGFTGDAITTSPGGKLVSNGMVFIGAKEVNIIEKYAEDKILPRLDLIIDWGWFYFLAKPLFYVLDFLYSYSGNFGVAILLLTVLIKTVFFPVVNRSYVQMAKMRKVQPEITKLREIYGDDRQRMAQEMQSLYKKEELKPLSGCLPVLIQIPVFFALYNVLLVTIEMRHAPFFGWIRDLSAPDPISLFNGFGLINWEPPQFLMIGLFHLLFGLTFFLQTKLNPTPADPIQKTLFTWMPVFMIFIAANFPVGLVIYWAWNGLLSILQQMYIMKRQGTEIALFTNINKNSDKNE
jgi:YidC/Oxa1 family membrane protein insertase|tara:strand:+ start:9024 stop:10742 length:1719 start_codon:yes stop_codon:yes gene_type:complete